MRVNNFRLSNKKRQKKKEKKKQKQKFKQTNFVFDKETNENLLKTT